MNRKTESMGATDDRFLNFEFLAYDLEKIAKDAGNGDANAMREGVKKMREWRAKFDSELAELETAVGDFSALDNLLDGDTP